MNIKDNYKGTISYVLIIVIGILLAQHMNVVVSGSMEPVLYKGDIIFVDPNVSNIQVGDIVVYYGTWTPTPENIVHRIIKKETATNGTSFYLTKGDNIYTNPEPDPLPVYPDQIRYKVITINNTPLKIPKRMRFRKKNKISDRHETLFKQIYTTKTTELELLLKIIEEKINLEGSNENLNHTKRIITTRLYSKNNPKQN